MKALWSSMFCHKVYNLYSWLTCFSFFPSPFSIYVFFFQSLVSTECRAVFFSSLYNPSNISELLQYFLPCVWLFLLLRPKAFGKFGALKSFWTLSHLFSSSSSLQSWVFISQGVLSLLSRVSHWGLLAAVISEGYQQAHLCVWCC